MGFWELSFSSTTRTRETIWDLFADYHEMSTMYLLRCVCSTGIPPSSVLAVSLEAVYDQAS